MRIIANHRADREELNQLINDYKRTMEEFNKKVEDILRNQSSAQYATSQTLNLSGISIVEPIEVNANIQAIKTFWSGMVEADNTAKSKFSDAQSGVQVLEGQITTFLEAIGTNGGKVGSLDINQLRETLFEDKKMLQFISDKLSSGKPLSPAERELLYIYIQEKLFNEEDHAQMKTISIFMELDHEKLKEYINEKVLASEATLEEEILRLELYLFTGNEQPGDQWIDDNDRIKLNSYLDLLKNYRIAINEVREEMEWERGKEEPLLARIEYVHFDFEDSPINGRSTSDVTIDIFQNTSGDRGISREEFLKMKNPLTVRRNFSEVEYYYGPDAVSDLQERRQLDLKDEIDTYTGEYIATELFSLVLKGPASIAYEGLKTFGGYAEGKKENEQRLTFEQLEQTASDFRLELQVNTRDVPGKSEDMQVQLLPTEETFDLLDRWEAVYQIEPDYPYPESKIEKQDWAGMNKFLYEDGNKADMKIDEGDRPVYYYILYGTPSDHPIVQQAMELSGN